jgi:hypothetical protein
MSDTSIVFELRRNGKLNDALTKAEELYKLDPHDAWVQKALAWTLIDLCKLALNSYDYRTAEFHFARLSAIQFSGHDEILHDQIRILSPKVDPLYEPVQKADELSKTGQHEEALSQMQQMIAKGDLKEKHHEAYGWIIYRFIKDANNKNKIVPTRTLLRDYLDLKNERPSMLHSIMLQFSIIFFKTNREFKLYKFFLLWGPKNLTTEDINDSFSADKRYPSTLFKLFREFVEAGIEIDSVVLQTSGLQLDNIRVLDAMREPYYWNFLHTGKDNKLQELWAKLTQYTASNRGLGGSLYHSKILSIALFTMKEHEEHRFLSFFIDWNPVNLTRDDWQEVVKDTKTYKPVALQAIKKAYDCIKLKKDFKPPESLLTAYAQAVTKYPGDHFLNREYALLLIKGGKFTEATEIYKSLAIELGAQPYIWHEFATSLDEDKIEIKIGMLAKGIGIQNDEAYLGDIRLDLAELLIKKDRKEAAAFQLQNYKIFRNQKSWPFADRYQELIKLAGNETLPNETKLDDNIKLAEDYAFAAYKWNEVVAVEKWKDEKKREMLLLTDGKLISFTTNSNRFRSLRNVVFGTPFRCRIVTKVENENHRFLKPVYNYAPIAIETSNSEAWSALPELVAVVGYINQEKNIIHATTSDNEEVFFKDTSNKFQKGTFVKARYYHKKVHEINRIEVCNPSICDKNEALSHFRIYTAVIDSINQSKEIFHFVINNTIQGIVKFDETSFIPELGALIKVNVVSRKDKKTNKIIYKALSISHTDEISPLKKSISGLLELKYKRNGVTLSTSDLEFDAKADFRPDFGFIGNYYVSKETLHVSKIILDTEVEGVAVFTGEKWKVIKLSKKE